MEDDQKNEQQGETNVPLAWGKVGGNPPPPPAPQPPARPSVEPPETPQPWAQEAAAHNPLRSPQPPTPPLGQSIGATPPPVPPTPTPAQGVTPPVLSTPAPSVPAGAETVVSSAAEPVLSGDYGVTPPPVAPEVASSSSKLPWIVALVGTLVLLGGGGFFALTAFNSTGGADTPDEAVEEMFAAISNEDFVTLGELIEPSERRTIVEPTITQILPELQRLDLLSAEADASNVEGVDFEVTDLTYRVEPIVDNPDMVHVFLTGGEFASEFNAAEFPFSDSYREFLGEDLQDEERTVEPIEETETPITFVQRDGKWYFSGWFSVAEAARLEAGERLPLASEAPPALGSESPEAAVEALFEEMVELDLAGMIGRMDPEELAALYRYSPLFLEEGQDGLDEFRQLLNDEDVAWDIRDFEFDVNTDGDDAIVEIRAFTFDVTSPDVNVSFTYSREAINASVSAAEGEGTLEATTTSWQIDGVVEGDPFTINVTLDPEAGVITGSGNFAGDTGEGEFTFDASGICSRYRVTIAGETEEGCLEEELGSEEEDLLGTYETVFDDWPTEFPGIAISARRTDGEWYVSPVSTVFDGMIAVLEQFEDGEFEAFTNSAMVADPLSGVGGMESVIADVVDDSVGTTSSEPSAQDIEDLLAELDSGIDASADAVVESNIEFTVDRGAVAELDESLSVGAYDLATVDLEAGDTVTITVRTQADGTLDSLLTLRFQESQQVVGQNDDAEFDAGLPSSLDSQLEVIITETGTYEILIGSYESESAGDYNLTVARS